MSKFDTSLYLILINHIPVYIIAYINYIIPAGTSEQELKTVSDIISNRVEMRIDDMVTKFPGIVIERYQKRGRWRFTLLLELSICRRLSNLKTFQGVSDLLATDILFQKETTGIVNLLLRNKSRTDNWWGHYYIFRIPLTQIFLFQVVICNRSWRILVKSTRNMESEIFGTCIKTNPYWLHSLIAMEQVCPDSLNYILEEIVRLSTV